MASHPTPPSTLARIGGGFGWTLKAKKSNDGGQGAGSGVSRVQAGRWAG